MPQKILIIYNPIASSGRAKAFAIELELKLVELGFSVNLERSKANESEYQNIKNLIELSDLVLVLGGDGTVRNLLRILADLQKPMHMVPLGNESLFAKQYGMLSSLESVVKVCQNSKLIAQNFIEINYNNHTEAFFTMCSMGLDSLTVKYIGLRKGPVNNWVYFKYGLKAFLKLRHPKITIHVDGQKVVDQKFGYLIIANTPQYAKDIALVPHANPNNCNLDLGFIKNSGIKEELQKGIAMLFRKRAHLNFSFFTGVAIKFIIHDQSYPLQLDGDYFLNQDLLPSSSIEFKTYKKPLLVAVSS
jgi:diacylglycerol kinase (ATP)